MRRSGILRTLARGRFCLASKLQMVRISSDAGSNGAISELRQYYIDPAWFYTALYDMDIDYFCGVPDSLLKDFCAYVSDNAATGQHVITANEGAAIGLATGYHLATRKTALVYLQNSGLGNTVNPLLSLANRNVYSIPMLLLIGWRGEPGRKDEPQHLVQGRCTMGMIDAMRIPVEVLPDYEEGAAEALKKAHDYLKKKPGPYCLLTKRLTFSSYKMRKADTESSRPSREECLRTIVDNSSPDDVFVGTTGMLSRELFEIRVSRNEGHHRDFLTVGSMGHASAIALGIAQQIAPRQVFCLDGDGSVLMHMGTMTTAGQLQLVNFRHVIINNGVHDSVGGQPTAAGADTLDFTAVARACGYSHVARVSTLSEIPAALAALRASRGPALLEILVRPGSRNDLGRPTTSTHENKNHFMQFISTSPTDEQH